MSKITPRYITTTLPYVNASPHMGHALEFVQADTLARFQRVIGKAVFFNLGVDEHGQKIAQKADEQGIARQAYVDTYAAEFQKLIATLNLSPDNFIRTTDPAHKAAVHEMWKRWDAAGDIYKKKYNGLYCVGCESFKTESDLVDGLCPDHKVAPEEIEEENYFFRLSNYQAYLEDYLATPGVIVPEYRRQEALTFVKKGLEDISISRETTRMDWGIPVPGDDSQVVYVWFDALTNYISTLGWPADADGNFQKFWLDGHTLQLAGKDQIRFQSIIWQAMLKCAGIKETDKIFYHGFINSDGHKMSKSLGNVIDPYELVARYGTDATRYLMLRHVHPTDDSDLTWEKMDEYYTANLVNGIGNVTARILKMTETHLEPEEFPLLDPTTLDAPDMLNFQHAMDHIWSLIQGLDERITTTEPYKLIKSDPEAAKAILAELRADLLHIGRLLLPAMPETSTAIRAAVRANQKPTNLFPRLES
mgnify:CR=1 FL=1